MTGIIFDKLKKLYKPRKNMDGFKSEQINRMAFEIAKILKRPIQKNDNAMLTMLCQELADDINAYMKYAMGSPYYASLSTLRLHRALYAHLCSDKIGFNVDELLKNTEQKGCVPVSDEQNAIFQDNIAFFNVPSEIFRVHTLLLKKRGVPLHPNFYKCSRDQVRRFKELLCTGVEPSAGNPHYNLDVIPQEIKANPVYQLFYANKANPTSPKLDGGELLKSNRYDQLVGMLYAGANYFSRIDTDIGMFTSNEFLNELDASKPFDELVFDDTHLALKLIDECKSLKAIAEAHDMLCKKDRPLLTERSGKIELTWQSLELTSSTVPYKLQEDVLITRAATRKIDAMCQALSNNFDAIKDKVNMNELTFVLKDYFSRDDNRGRSGLTVNVPKAIVDLRLKGVANLFVKLHQLPRERFGEYGPVNILSCLHFLPIPTLTEIIRNAEITKLQAETVIEGAKTRNLPLHYALHSDMAIENMAELLATADKAYPGIHKHCPILSQVKDRLVKYDDDYRANLGSRFAAAYTGCYYGDLTNLMTGNQQIADLSFIESKAV